MEVNIANKQTNEKLENMVGQDEIQEDVDEMMREL